MLETEQQPTRLAPPKRGRARRHKMLKAAKLIAPKAWAFVDGVVLDISETGARIECDFLHQVQDEFRLLIVTNAAIRPCRVVWRGKKEMGVAFIGDAQPAPPRKF